MDRKHAQHRSWMVIFNQRGLIQNNKKIGQRNIDEFSVRHQQKKHIAAFNNPSYRILDQQPSKHLIEKFNTKTIVTVKQKAETHHLYLRYQRNTITTQLMRTTTQNSCMNPVSSKTKPLIEKTQEGLRTPNVRIFSFLEPKNYYMCVQNLFLKSSIRQKWFLQLKMSTS